VADLDERVSAKALALGLPKRAWRTIRWRDGRADPLRSRLCPRAGAHRADQAHDGSFTMDDYESLSHTKWECTTYCSFPSIAIGVRSKL
jgi:hypothetical protein